MAREGLTPVSSQALKLNADSGPCSRLREEGRVGTRTHEECMGGPTRRAPCMHAWGTTGACMGYYWGMHEHACMRGYCCLTPTPAFWRR